MGRHFIIFFVTEICGTTNIIAFAALQDPPYSIQQEESAVCWCYNNVVSSLELTGVVAGRPL